MKPGDWVVPKLQVLGWADSSNALVIIKRSTKGTKPPGSWWSWWAKKAKDESNPCRLVLISEDSYIVWKTREEVVAEELMK